MLRSICWAVALALTTTIGIGCTDQTAAPVDDGAPAVETTPAATPEGADQPAEADAAVETTAVELSEDDIAQIKKLPAEDQALALAQKVCASTGEPLGSMGVPVKVMANDTPVFVCCKGCVEDIESDPDAALARLGKK